MDCLVCFFLLLFSFTFMTTHLMGWISLIVLRKGLFHQFLSLMSYGLGKSLGMNTLTQHMASAVPSISTTSRETIEPNLLQLC